MKKYVKLYKPAYNIANNTNKAFACRRIYYNPTAQQRPFIIVDFYTASNSTRFLTTPQSSFIIVLKQCIKVFN